MARNTLVIILIGVVIVVCLLLVRTNRQESSADTNTSPAQSVDRKDEVEREGTIFDLLDNQPKQCRFQSRYTTYDLAGTVYTSEQRFRVNVTAGTLNDITRMTMIGDGNVVSAWTDRNTDDLFTVTYQKSKELLSDPPSRPSSVQQVLASRKYLCQPWNVEEQKFNIPSGQ